MFRHWRFLELNRCGDDIIDADNGNDGDKINRHFAEYLDPLHNRWEVLLSRFIYLSE